MQYSKFILRAYTWLIILQIKECDCYFQSCSYCSIVQGFFICHIINYTDKETLNNATVAAGLEITVTFFKL